MTKNLRWALSIAVGGLAVLMASTWALAMPPRSGPPAPLPQITARPTPGGPPQPGGNGPSGRDEGPHSAVEGVVTDLSSGQPGAGLKVQIGDVVVLTDARGHYSLTGLGAWTMETRLLLEVGQGVPAQGSVVVRLDGVHTEVVNLGFYRRPLPAPTPTVTPLPPLVLPETGGAGR